MNGIRFLHLLRFLGSALGEGEQEDSHEFMRFAVDTMQKVCLDGVGGEGKVGPRSEETTFIHHVFGGLLLSKVQCMECHTASLRYESILDVACEIEGGVMSLEEALTRFTAVEWLDGDNKYSCDK